MDELRRRWAEYEEKLSVMGERRNSYSKTDTDATFMRMKEDHMRNGQLKPAYNVQIAVNSEYITGVDVFSDRTDLGTLVPFLKTLQREHGKKYDSVTADAGYERLGNYLFLESNGQMSFIKPANYEQQKSAKYKKQLGRMDNMTYDADEDCYTCANGRKLLLRIAHGTAKRAICDDGVVSLRGLQGLPAARKVLSGKGPGAAKGASRQQDAARITQGLTGEHYQRTRD